MANIDDFLKAVGLIVLGKILLIIVTLNSTIIDTKLDKIGYGVITQIKQSIEGTLFLIF
ncbi:MAG: hypothetical protein E6538_13350 [Paeniclostridium sordellii]|nr:hypothetical protein [Paeniclostridium sordellii]